MSTPRLPQTAISEDDLFMRRGRPDRYTPVMILLLILAFVVAVFVGVYLWHQYGSSSD